MAFFHLHEKGVAEVYLDMLKFVIDTYCQKQEHCGKVLGEMTSQGKCICKQVSTSIAYDSKIAYSMMLLWLMMWL